MSEGGGKTGRTGREGGGKTKAGRGDIDISLYILIILYFLSTLKYIFRNKVIDESIYIELFRGIA